MKFLLIFFIALGLVLSCVLTLEYNCVGNEVFPKYWGSPFVFKQSSLASSLEYHYSVLGLLANTLIYSIILGIIHYYFVFFIAKNRFKKPLFILYKMGIMLLLLFSIASCTFSTLIMGSGFGKHSNYWYFELDKEASDWGMQCSGTWVVFNF